MLRSPRRSSGRIVTVARAVLDSSILVRASLEESEAARAWVESVEEKRVQGLAPQLVWLEVASALGRYVSSGSMEASTAFEALEILLALPLSVQPLESLAEPALEAALKHRLSVYDASYLALAQVADAVLVTADRRLAEAANRSELVT